MKDFVGKVAVVTGGAASRGIGRATGAILAKRGAMVVLADNDKGALDQTIEELTGNNLRVDGIEADVTDFASMKGLADAVFNRYGHVDILHLNAGGGGSGSLFDEDPAPWYRSFGLNCFGVLHGIQVFVPRMINQGTHGHVVVTTSGAGANGTLSLTPPYSAAKAAAQTLTECLYAQLRDRGADIQVSVLLPSLTRTTAMASDPTQIAQVVESRRRAGVPSEYLEPEEVAALVVEGIEGDNFWINRTHEQDARLTNGRFRDWIEWDDNLARERCASYVNRTAPDGYIWPHAGSSAPQ